MPDYQSPIPSYAAWSETMPQTSSRVIEAAEKTGYNAAKRAGDEALEEQQIEIDHIKRLLRHERKPHGTCRPRSRRACTACNARDELDAIVAAWRGPKITPPRTALSKHTEKDHAPLHLQTQ